METGSIKNALREIRTLYSVGTLGGRSDAQLLELFLARNGDDAESAFAALVERHGPTVLGVCRRMLPSAHDCEDAFQATFLVLSRRAGSIGRREKLAAWLYGVAVRTAKEARRRAARDRTGERRLMDLSRVESSPTEVRDDLLACLDEELNRLPERYRAALVACELDGKSRREAATELGIPEGTLSTHLARGRKLLRERLVRRGVSLGIGPLAGSSRPIDLAGVPERLLEPTVRAAVGYASRGGASATVSAAVAALAERVVKTMFLARLTLILASVMAAGTGAVAVVLLGLSALAAGVRNPDPPRPGPDDLPGRVVDKSGAGMAGVQVWAIDGSGWTPDTVATATTDVLGRFVVPCAVHLSGPHSQYFGLFARARDGRVGWMRPVWFNGADGKTVEIELKAVADARGRLTDHNGRPIAGVEVATVVMIRSAEPNSTDFIYLSLDLTSRFRTTTAADGSFVLKGIPQGARIHAAIASPDFGTPSVSWDTTRPATIVLDGRLGRIKGQLKRPDARGLARRFPLELHGSSQFESSAPGPYSVFCRRDGRAELDGTFQFDNLPPGRYVVDTFFGEDGLVATKPRYVVPVGPGAIAQLEIALDRLPMMTGRLVDAQTGKGVAGVKLMSLLLEEGRNSNMVCDQATTDAQGRYKIMARPGKILVKITDVPKTHLGLNYSEFPIIDVTAADQNLPELKLSPAIGLDGVVVDRAGRPVAGARVFAVVRDPPGSSAHDLPVLTGPGGTFHVEQLDPDDLVSLRALSGNATTNGAVIINPREVMAKGKLTLTIDPAHSVRIRALVTDLTGKRIVGATTTLRWHRSFATQKPKQASEMGSPLATYSTGDNGWFVFRGLWAGDRYSVVIEAKGQARIETPEVTGKAGETHDLGKIVLINTGGSLAGRVIGSDGRPVDGANVFNRGDAPEHVATATDSQGGFRLRGMFPGPKFAFVRKEGYRFTGIKADDDADGLTITLLKTGERSPAWKRGSASSYDEQRAFAKGVLIRLWEKYGALPEKTGASDCIQYMAQIDSNLALEWSSQHGRRYDNVVRRSQARKLAETDAPGALAMLKQNPDRDTQALLHSLAERFAETDPKKAITFAEEAAVQANGLARFDRTVAMAGAGAVLLKLGRADAGAKLIDQAARDALDLGTQDRAGYYRSLVAEALAPIDLKRALALIEPIEDDEKMPAAKSARYARVATAIAKSDIDRAVALVDATAGPGFDYELAKTEIAFKIGADRPDEAIKIIEGMKRDPRRDAQWQAAAFGWLAVSLAPRDRVRAFGLIDRALDMMVDRRNGIRPTSEFAVAARIAVCARRIDYPDMASAIMRVLAARFHGDARWDKRTLIESATEAAVALALIDPQTARTVLEQIEARSGLDGATERKTREQSLIAWALVDLEKAEARVDAGLSALDAAKDFDLWNTGLFQMVEFLTTPLDRRDELLGKRSAGGF
jgi:RNA polymerase sigma factor (sigma-70 family)